MRLQGAPLPVGRAVTAAARRLGQPGLLQEAAHLVDDRQAERFAQREGHSAIRVIGGRVQDRGAEPFDEPGGEFGVAGEGGLRSPRHPQGQQAVVGHPVNDLRGASVPDPLGHGEAQPGDDLRVQARLPLGACDGVRPDGVTGVAVRQGVGDQVQHPPRHRRTRDTGRGGHAARPVPAGAAAPAVRIALGQPGQRPPGGPPRRPRGDPQGQGRRAHRVVPQMTYRHRGGENQGTKSTTTHIPTLSTSSQREAPCSAR